jgi:hypothetical protein
MGSRLKYAFIGDVHSQSKPLREALRYCKTMGLTPILLGDLFNSSCHISDSVDVLKLVIHAKKNMGGIVLQSNHQRKLELCLKDPKHVPKKNVKRTIKDFEEANLPLELVLKYMDTFPMALALKDSRGKEYRVAHAEFPLSLEVPKYRDIWLYPKASSSEEEQLLLWGVDYSKSDKERFWWLHNENRDWIRVSGHYHRVINDGKSLVLDAGCGGKTRAWYLKDEPPKLALYDVEARRIVEFEVF